MKYNTCLFALMLSALLVVPRYARSQEDKFTRKTTMVRFYRDKQWTKPQESPTTFLINCNNHGDISYLTVNDELLILIKMGAAKKGYTDDGEEYQIIKMRDSEGDTVYFTLYTEKRLGIKLIYPNIDFVIHFLPDDY